MLSIFHWLYWIWMASYQAVTYQRFRFQADLKTTLIQGGAFHLHLGRNAGILLNSSEISSRKFHLIFNSHCIYIYIYSLNDEYGEES